jgi:nitroreductase
VPSLSFPKLFQFNLMRLHVGFCQFARRVNITAQGSVTLVLIILKLDAHQSLRLLRRGLELPNETVLFFRWILFHGVFRMSMEIFEAITNRRSVRAYKKRQLPLGTIEKLLDAARWAPSAGNVQPWAFVVAASTDMKRALSLAAYSQRDIEDASIVIVVCADEKRAEERYGVRGKTLYCLQDTAAATQNILLTAYSLGLGSCWVGAFKEEQVRKAIRAPDEMRPVAMIPVGYPDEAPEARGRRSLSEIMNMETF